MDLAAYLFISRDEIPRENHPSLRLSEIFVYSRILPGSSNRQQATVEPVSNMSAQSNAPAKRKANAASDVSQLAGNVRLRSFWDLLDKAKEPLQRKPKRALLKAVAFHNLLISKCAFSLQMLDA